VFAATDSAPSPRAAERGSLLSVRDLGRVAYADAVKLQDELVEARLRDDIPDTLLLLEHSPVITLGRRAGLEDVYASEARLAELGIDLQRATRGGLVTYHGPGQLIGYPIVKLRPLGLTVPCYVRALELSIITALGDLGIEAFFDEDHVGVWTSRGKIAAIGVAQRHGVTLHGFAVNLQPDLSHFSLINPCGLAEMGVTSAAAILGHPIQTESFKSSVTTALQLQLSAQSCRRESPAV
jgi:lipoate-protein ligase B